MSEFEAPLSRENLMHTILKDIQNRIIDNKKEIDRKLERMTDDISEIRSSVDKLAIDHLLGDIKEVKANYDHLDDRVKKVESYHNKVLGIIAFVGFVLAIIAILKEYIFK